MDRDTYEQALRQADQAAKTNQDGLIYDQSPVAITVHDGAVVIRVRPIAGNSGVYDLLRRIAVNHAVGNRITSSRESDAAYFTYTPR